MDTEKEKTVKKCSKEETKPLQTLEEALNWSPEATKTFTYPETYTRSSYYLSGDTWTHRNRSWDSLVSIPLIKVYRLRFDLKAIPGFLYVHIGDPLHTSV